MILQAPFSCLLPRQGLPSALLRVPRVLLLGLPTWRARALCYLVFPGHPRRRLFRLPLRLFPHGQGPAKHVFQRGHRQIS